MDNKGIVAAVAALLVAGVAGGLAVWCELPPAPLGMDAPPAVFSAARAIAGLRAIPESTVAHPNPSPAIEQYRGHLVSRLRDLGYDAQVQTAVVWNKRRNANATIGNVVARLEGTRPNAALLLSAHYDSVSNGPGATDDGIGVAALLEIARILRSEPKPCNPVIFLFADAEEQGLLGSRAFVARHPWAGTVKVVLNIDAGGDRGPSSVVETGPGSRRLAELFARVVARPSGSSANHEFRRLFSARPDDSDFYPFRMAGAAGFYFANFYGKNVVHSPRDTPGAVPLDTLQHHGDNVLAMARALRNADLDAIQSGESVFTSLFGRVVVYYPAEWARPLSLLCAALAAVALWRLRPRERLLPQLLAWPAGIIVSVAVGVGASLALKAAFGERTFLPRPFVAASVTVTLSLAAFFAVERFFGRWLSRAGLAGGMLAWWGTLAVALSFWNPGLSYLLTWPAMALAVAALLVPEGRLWLALPITILPGAILFIPLIVQIVLGVSPLHPFAPLFGVLAAGFAAPGFHGVPAERSDS